MRRRALGRFMLRCGLSVLIAIMLMYFAVTGSPIPLWHLEELTDPVRVQSINETSLSLADGREVGLPFIKRLPKDDALFLAAVQDGVEVHVDGRVYGLLWAERVCGNDAVYWRRLKVNLSELAGAISPAGLDESQLHPETVEFLCETVPRRSRALEKIAICTLADRQGMRQVGNQFSHVLKARGVRN